MSSFEQAVDELKSIDTIPLRGHFVNYVEHASPAKLNKATPDGLTLAGVVTKFNGSASHIIVKALVIHGLVPTVQDLKVAEKTLKNDQWPCARQLLETMKFAMEEAITAGRTYEGRNGKVTPRTQNGRSFMGLMNQTRRRASSAVTAAPQHPDHTHE